MAYTHDKRWTYKNKIGDKDASLLSKKINTPITLSKILLQRGITNFEEAKRFFRPQLSELHNPFLMSGMDRAVERIETAIERGENILIYGDYDVDGTTSVSLVYLFLKQITEQVFYYIPDRYNEGYGISFKGIDFANDNDFSLIITLDCGIKALDKVDYANEKGIDVIICDHHTPGIEVPKAYSILNPKQLHCKYPYKELSGCGIGFKLIQALATNFDIDKNIVYSYLDLVAISTACDIVPINGENRILAHYGLLVLNSNPRFGIKAILDLEGIKKALSISDVVFKIGPRINAAGRINHAHNSVRLLISESEKEAQEISKLINQYNTERRGFDSSISEQAVEMIRNNEIETKYSTVLYDKNWHKGVVGIVASRVIETFYRPTIILTESNGKAAGSARSVQGYNVYDAISKCADLLEQFGGHKYAAGLTLPIENIEAFRDKFEQVVSDTITDDLLLPEIEIDSELNFEDITPKFYNILKQLSPFGPENMRPVFVSKSVVDSGYTKAVGEENKHLKISVVQKSNPNKKMDGIAFNFGHLESEIKSGTPFSFAYSIEENEWQGNVSLQLNVKDIKFADS